MQGNGCRTRFAMVGAVCLASSMLARGETQPSDPLEALRVQLDQLRETLKAMNDELAGTRRESQELRQELRAVREELAGVRSQSGGASVADRPPERAGSLDDRVATLAEDQQLLGAKIEDQYQTKVESGAKYRVRLSWAGAIQIGRAHV